MKCAQHEIIAEANLIIFIYSFMQEFEVWEFGMLLFCNGFRLDMMMTMCCSRVNMIQSTSSTQNP